MIWGREKTQATKSEVFEVSSLLCCSYFKFPVVGFSYLVFPLREKLLFRLEKKYKALYGFQGATGEGTLIGNFSRGEVLGRQ